MQEKLGESGVAEYQITPANSDNVPHTHKLPYMWGEMFSSSLPVKVILSLHGCLCISGVSFGKSKGNTIRRCVLHCVHSLKVQSNQAKAFGTDPLFHSNCVFPGSTPPSSSPSSLLFYFPKEEQRILSVSPPLRISYRTSNYLFVFQSPSVDLGVISAESQSCCFITDFR